MSRLQKLPYFISHFLGYRKPDYKPKALPSWKIYFWSFLASWIGIALLEIIFTYSSSFQSHNTPMIIASFGATAVLAYGVIEAPLAQPRNIVCGHTIGSVTGVIIAQLFLNIQHHWASEAQRIAVQWVGGATAMALSLTLMQITKTVHPPAGATALIAVVTPNIIDISWFYIGIIVLSATIQVVIACFFNNIERRYPQYWWTPHVPIKVDPSTVKTVIPDLDETEEEDMVFNNLTVAEEGRLQSERKNSGTTTIESFTQIKSVEHAIKSLQEKAEESKTPFVLIAPGIPLVATPGLLSEDDLMTLNSLLTKLNSKAASK